MRRLTFLRVSAFAAALLPFASGAVPAGRVFFDGGNGELSLGAPSSAFVLQRLKLDGGAVGPTEPALEVQVGSSSSAGQLAAAPVDPTASAQWAGSLNVSFAQGAGVSTPFAYRDGAPGSPSLVADAGASWTGAAQPLAVSTSVLADDFEAGLLLWPDGGVWNAQLEVAGTSLAVNAVGAHRGTAGLHVTDTDGQGGSGAGSALQFYSAPITGSVYARAWFRLETPTPQGSVTVLDFPFGPASVTCETALESSSAFLQFGGRDDAGYTRDITAFSVGDGGWHLLEMGVTGMGTASGTRSLWMDGVLASQRGPQDWRGFSFSRVRVGEPFSSNQSFTGSFDFDDVRVSSVPPASHLVAQPSQALRTGACVPVALSLLDSLGGAAAAPYDVDAGLGAMGVSGTFHANATCSSPIRQWVIPAGTNSAQAFFLVSGAGDGGLLATHPDFLSTTGGVVASGLQAIITPADQTLDAGLAALLIGGGSPSSGATLTGFEWQQVEGPTAVTLGSGATQVLAFSLPGRYAFELSVVDSTGAISAPARATVEVAGDFARPPATLDGCHCGATSLPPWTALALVALARRRRRSTSGTARAVADFQVDLRRLA